MCARGSAAEWDQPVWVLTKEFLGDVKVCGVFTSDPQARLVARTSYEDDAGNMRFHHYVFYVDNIGEFDPKGFRGELIPRGEQSKIVRERRDPRRH